MLTARAVGVGLRMGLGLRMGKIFDDVAKDRKRHMAGRRYLYLDMETEQNVEMYEHYGFSVLDRVLLPEMRVPFWEMLREPAS